MIPSMTHPFPCPLSHLNPTFFPRSKLSIPLKPPSLAVTPSFFPPSVAYFFSLLPSSFPCTSSPLSIPTKPPPLSIPVLPPPPPLSGQGHLPLKTSSPVEMVLLSQWTTEPNGLHLWCVMPLSRFLPFESYFMKLPSSSSLLLTLLASLVVSSSLSLVLSPLLWVIAQRTHRPMPQP